MAEGTRPSAILIAGPTASGKSGLALRLAHRFGGAVVNADSMQVYDGLQILTARPGAAETQGVPHHLYGHRQPAAPYSAGDWLREAVPLLGRLAEEDRVPIVCGGTGLYFRALLEGFEEMPTVPPEIRERWRARMEAEGPLALHAELAERDPGSAAKLRPSDRQRITRALELREARISAVEAAPPVVIPAPIDFSRATKIVIAPDRAVLRARIAHRFDAMLAAGAMEEAIGFAARPGAAEGLAGKAIGLAELLAAHRGEIGLAEARERAITRTRQYAKRQETWFRNQFGADWRRIADPGEIDR